MTDHCEADPYVLYGRIDPRAEYYAMTFTSDGLEIQWSTQTRFVGFAEGDPGVELRAASLVKPHRMAKLWADLGQPALVVSTDEDLGVWLVFGGNALVQAGTARRKLPDLLEPRPSVREGWLGGLTSQGDAIKAARRRHPTPKQRMQILRRDGYRCRVCGRNADDALDLRLHLHHIQEYAAGGSFSRGVHLLQPRRTASARA